MRAMSILASTILAGSTIAIMSAPAAEAAVPSGCQTDLFSTRAKATCTTAAPGTQFRAGAYCKGDAGYEWRNGAWKTQTSGPNWNVYSEAICRSGYTRVGYRVETA